MTQKKTTQKTNRRFKPGSHPSSPRFCYLWIWIVIFFVAIQYVSSSVPPRPLFNYGNFTNSASSRARFRRDTSKLDNAVRNLGHLARVANGITLEIGLVDGSIKPGEAVSELLLMGDLQLDDIISLNHDSIEKVLTAMSQKIQTDQQVEKLEQRLMRMEDVREISPQLQNLKEIPGLKEFETSFKAVKDLAPHKANFTGIQRHVDVFVSRLEILEGMAKVGFTEESRNDAVSMIGSVSFDIKYFQNFQAYFGLVKKLIDEAKKMPDNSKFIEYLAKENKFRTSEAVDYTALKPLLLDSFQKVNDDFQEASSAQKEFESILKLVETRSPLHRQTFQHTAGFPRGSDDLKDLEQSIEDPSIISRISNGESVKKDLKAAFESFKNLEKEIEVISSDWKGLEAQYKSVYDVVSNVIELGKLSGVSQSISDTVGKLVACDKGQYPTETLDKNLAASIQAFSNKIGELGSFGYPGSFANLDSLKKSFATKGLLVDKEPEFITNALNIWKTDEDLKTFVTKVRKLDKDLIKLLAFLNGDPTKEDELAKVTKHLKNIDQPDYTTFLKCVKDIQVDGFPVREMIKFIQGSKKIPPQEAKDAITKVTQSGTRLSSAQSLAGKFKSDGKLTPKIEVFKASFEKENYEEVSRKLGMGVQGLAAILKVRTAKIGGLVGMTERILNEAKTDGLSPEQQKSLQQLKEVKTVLDSIDTFLQTSKGLQALRRKRNAGFESFQEVLKDAANVQGATIVVNSLREATNALKKLKVNGMEIDTLATLDLDFAKFNMADAVSSLISMDKFFKKYIALLSGAPGAGNSVTTKPGQKGPLASADSLVEATTKSWSEEYFYVYIIIAIFVLLIVLALVYFGKPWEKCGKKKEKTPVPKPPTPAPPAPPNPNPNRADNQEEPGRPNIDQNGAEDVPRVNFPDVPRVNFPDAEYQPVAPDAGQNQQVDAPVAGAAPVRRARRNVAPGQQRAVDPPVVADGAEGHENFGGGAGDHANDGPVVENQQDPAAGAGDAQGGAQPPPRPPPREPGERDLDRTQEETARRNNVKALKLSHTHAGMLYTGVKKGIPPDVSEYRLHESFQRPKQFEYYIRENSIDQPIDNIRQKITEMSCYLSTIPEIRGLESTFINCNTLFFQNGVWYVGQHPLDGANGKDDTREMQLALIHQHNITMVAQLYGENEVNSSVVYYPLEVGNNPENIMTFGRYSARTTAITQGTNLGSFTEANLFTLYYVEITDNETKETKNVRFLKYVGWSVDRPPTVIETAREIISYLDSSNGKENTEKPKVLVNCSDGVGRSGTLITIKHGISICQSVEIEKLYQLVKTVRETRFNAVSKPLECAYAVLAITNGIMHERGIGFYRDYWVVYYYYAKMWEGNQYELLKNSNNADLKAAFIAKDIKNMCNFCAQREDEWSLNEVGVKIDIDKKWGVNDLFEPREVPKENKKKGHRAKKNKNKKADSKKIKRHIPRDEKEKKMRKYRDK